MIFKWHDEDCAGTAKGLAGTWMANHADYSKQNKNSVRETNGRAKQSNPIINAAESLLGSHYANAASATIGHGERRVIAHSGSSRANDKGASRSYFDTAANKSDFRRAENR